MYMHSDALGIFYLSSVAQTHLTHILPLTVIRIVPSSQNLVIAKLADLRRSEHMTLVGLWS